MLMPWSLALLFAITPVQALPPPASTALRGIVVDAQTAAPLRDARVLITELGRSAQSGADGRFEFQNVAPGSYTLTVSLIGFVFVRRHVDVAAGGMPDLTVPLAEGTGAYQETVTVKPDAAGDVGVGSQSELGSAG